MNYFLLLVKKGTDCRILSVELKTNQNAVKIMPGDHQSGQLTDTPLSQGAGSGVHTQPANSYALRISSTYNISILLG